MSMIAHHGQTARAWRHSRASISSAPTSFSSPLERQLLQRTIASLSALLDPLDVRTIEGPQYPSGGRGFGATDVAFAAFAAAAAAAAARAALMIAASEALRHCQETQ